MYLVSFPMKQYPNIFKVDCSFRNLSDAVRYAGIIVNAGVATESRIVNEDNHAICTPDELHAAVLEAQS